MVGSNLDMPCALGRSGIGIGKREGDGATPAGRFRALGAFHRADRLPRPCSMLRSRPIARALGWCDDPAHRLYNRPVRLPFGPSHERMWREDALYDLVIDLSHNRGPIRRGAGSAIFLHSARPGFGPTEGCIAVARSAIAKLANRIGPDTVLVIGGAAARARRR